MPAKRGGEKKSGQVSVTEGGEDIQKGGGEGQRGKSQSLATSERKNT